MSMIPKLTKEEAEVAKRRAFEYPPGYGTVWGVDLDDFMDPDYASPEQADDAACFFADFPSHVHRG